MITRRTALKGMAAGLLGSVAAAGYIGKKEQGLSVLDAADHNPLSHADDCPYGCGVQYNGFGLAQAKPEGGRIYYDPMDDPEYRGPQGQGGRYALRHQS